MWNDKHNDGDILLSCAQSLRDLGLDYLDLYLIHWPKSLNKESWKALIKINEDRGTRAIGVSNFQVPHLDEIIEDSGVVPAVNQIELHPCFNQKELRSYCADKNIIIEAWGPLMQGRIFSEPLFMELSKQYNKTIAQIALRWHYQLNVVTLPKSVNPDRIRANCEIFDFTVSDEDMERINAMNQERFGPDPDNFDF